jgi:phage tail sheath protein FI
MAYHHGITLVEASDGVRALRTVATAVIGLVATGPLADATAFPLNRPVIVTDADAAIGKAGATGTLANTLRAISDQVRTPIVVVRVEDHATPATLAANVVGTTLVNGQKTGLQALTAAQAQLGVNPRIIGAPGLDSATVTAALVVVAKKLRARAYAAALGADIAAAVAYRAGYSARELMLIYPDVIGTKADGTTGAVPAVAYALGLRAKIDQETGFHKTISNVPLDGVVGLARDIQFDIQDGSTEAGVLNAADVTAVVRSDTGFRLWGSRTCSDDPLFAFESATATAQVLADTIGQGLIWAIDKPLRPSLAKDIVETINAKLREMKSAGLILGGQASFSIDKNPNASLQAGKLAIDYDYTPVPPLEQLGLTQRITDTYLVDFAALAAAR